jgi:hypothetical protein
MANTSVFTGADGSLALSTQQTPEGTAAQAAIDQFGVQVIGRVQDVTVQVSSDVKPFHEVGQRYATQLRPGNVEVRGTIGRAYINGAMLTLLLGEAAASRPAQSWTQPTFSMTLVASNSAVPGVTSTLTLHDVKIDSWSFHMPEDDFLLESVGFRALFITVGDEG